MAWAFSQTTIPQIFLHPTFIKLSSKGALSLIPEGYISENLQSIVADPSLQKNLSVMLVCQ